MGNPVVPQAGNPFMYYVTKTYGHELGLSACFRQWKAESHCHFLHGYPLSFKFTFGAEVLDKNNWVIDFGGLKEIKAFLVDKFDHKLLIARDDPKLEQLMDLVGEGLADPTIIPAVGCEGFAKYVFTYVDEWLHFTDHSPRVMLCQVEVREHGGNSAIYTGEPNYD